MCTSSVRPPGSSCTRWQLASVRKSIFTASGPFRSTRRENRSNTTTTILLSTSTPPARVLTPCLWSSGPWAHCTDRGRCSSTPGAVMWRRDHRSRSRANSLKGDLHGNHSFDCCRTFMKLDLTYFRQLEWTFFLFRALFCDLFDCCVLLFHEISMATLKITRPFFSFVHGAPVESICFLLNIDFRRFKALTYFQYKFQDSEHIFVFSK